MNKRMTSLEGKFKESEIEFEGQSDVSIPSNEIKNVMNPCMLSIQSNTIQIPEEELKHFDEIVTNYILHSLIIK